MSEIPTPPTNKYFLRLKEAAAILGVGETFMRSIVSGKRGPNRPRVVRMGHVYCLPTQEFFEWVNRQTERWPSQKQGKK